jgi:hypothetical protein
MQIKLFGPWREQVTGGWGKLHGGKIYNFTIYQLSLESSNQRMREDVAWRTRDMDGTCMQNFGRKRKEKRRVGRPAPR